MECMRPILASSRALRATHRQLLYSRCIASSAQQHATPIPFPAVAGPPPAPPSADVSQPENRVERKRKQAELLQKGLALKASPGKPAATLQKRFWKDVLVKETPDGFEVMLDTRPVRVASKNVLLIPRNKHLLAAAIALEWDLLVTAQQALKQHYIPLTSLTSRAMDIRDADAQGNPKIRNDIVTMLMNYLHTDTLLCWAEETNLYTGQVERRDGQTLRQKQEQVAQPIIAYLTSAIWPGVQINPVLEEGSILPTPQPPMTQEVIKGWISGLSAYDLAGLERAVLASKSLLVSVRFLVQWSDDFKDVRRGLGQASSFDVEDASEASTLEVTWQTRQWGEVDDTHDVDREDLRRQLGSVILLVHGDGK